MPRRTNERFTANAPSHSGCIYSEKTKKKIPQQTCRNMQYTLSKYRKVSMISVIGSSICSGIILLAGVVEIVSRFQRMSLSDRRKTYDPDYARNAKVSAAAERKREKGLLGGGAGARARSASLGSISQTDRRRTSDEQFYTLSTFDTIKLNLDSRIVYWESVVSYSNRLVFVLAMISSILQFGFIGITNDRNEKNMGLVKGLERIGAWNKKYCAVETPNYENDGITKQMIKDNRGYFDPPVDPPPS